MWFKHPSGLLFVRHCKFANVIFTLKYFGIYIMIYIIIIYILYIYKCGENERNVNCEVLMI